MERPTRSLARRAAGTAARVARNRYRRAVDHATLSDSDLFDHEWYSHCVGFRMDRDTAVDHYLEHGRVNQWTPNPLFDPDFFAETNPELIHGDQDPFVTYVRGRHWWAQVHPLVMIRRYNNDFPEALDYPTGPIGHYLDIGAVRGHRINAWYDEKDRANPRGLADWMWQQVAGWHAVREGTESPWGDAPIAARSEQPPTPRADIGLISVALVAADRAEAVRESLDSILAQDYPDIEVLFAPVEGSAPVDLPDDPRIRLLPPATSRWTALNAALEAAHGKWFAPALEGDIWFRSRLSNLAPALTGSAQWAHDAVADLTRKRFPRYLVRPITLPALLAGAEPELGSVICTAPLARSVGGFDPALEHAAAVRFLIDLAEDQPPVFVASTGLEVHRFHLWAPAPSRKPWLSPAEVPGYRDVALSSELIDWASAGERPADPDVTTIIVPTYNDYDMTRKAVMDVAFHATRDDTPVEILVVDNGCAQLTSTVLASLEHQYAKAEQIRSIKVLHSPVNRGFALGNNLALPHASGSVVVFLNNDTLVEAGWLDRIREELAKPEVLATQPLLVYEGGAVQSAGVVFPPGGGVPHALLQGFPREDARGLADLPLRALTGAALAIRREDALALRGFDPIFTNGMEDVDLCLRLAELRDGHCTLLPEVHVTHFESRTEGRFTHSLVNRKVFLRRWEGREPVDDAAAWGAAGYEIIGRQIRQRPTKDNRICVAEPVVRRSDRAVVSESAPRLRWAIKNPAPYGEEGARWGDTHYAKALAEALRRLDQDVVIDYSMEFDRSTAWHDDVNLLLRGVEGFAPPPQQVNLKWVISHPEMLGISEGTGWDHIYVASAHYAPIMAEKWESPTSALLQATDPSLFHPDRAEPDHGYPLLFLGNSRNTRRPMVDWAIERNLPVSIIGGAWQDLVPEGYVRDRFLANDEAGAAYRSAGFVLNDHWDDMRDLGFLSNRLFDAVAAGGRVISDDVVGLKEVFGDAVKVVRSADELAALVKAPNLDEIFGTDAERRAMAAHIAAEHSFDRRAERMLDDAVRAWRGKYS